MATVTPFEYRQGDPTGNGRNREIVSGFATIDINETATLPIPCGGRSVVRLGLPTLTGTSLSFTVQPFPPADPAAPTLDPPFRTLRDRDGNTVTVAVGGTGVVEVPQLSGCYAFTIVSGSAQAAAREIEVQMVGANPVPFEAGLSFARRQAEFVSDLTALLGDTRLLWMPQPSNTTTATTLDLNQRTVTWDATVAGRLTPLGFGYQQSFNGTSQTGSAPDTANLSFGNGVTDSAFSLIAVGNVTNTAGFRTFAAKISAAATTAEYYMDISDADLLRLVLVDQSAGAFPFRASDAAITMGSPAVFAATYTAATGGATAANDITLYQNGVSIASTATNVVTYVAMEDTTAPFYIGAQGTTQSWYSGTEAMVALCQTALTASQHWAIYQLAKYYGLVA